MYKTKIIFAAVFIYTFNLYCCDSKDAITTGPLNLHDLEITVKCNGQKQLKSCIVPFPLNPSHMEQTIMEQKNGFIFFPTINNVAWQCTKDTTIRTPIDIFPFDTDSKKLAYAVCRQTVPSSNVRQAAQLLQYFSIRTEEDKLYYTIAAQRLGEASWEQKDIHDAKFYFKKAIETTNFTGSLFYLMMLNEAEARPFEMAYCYERAKWHGFNCSSIKENDIYSFFTNPQQIKSIIRDRIAQNPHEPFYSEEAQEPHNILSRAERFFIQIHELNK